MEHPLRGPHIKIKRAYAHLEEMRGEIQAYFRSTKPQIIVEPDETGDRLVKVVGRAPLSDNLFVLVAEHAYHLRSTLDQTMSAIGRTNNAAKPKEIYFPFAKDETDYWAKGTQKKVRQLPTDVQQMLANLKPWEDGNPRLWGLSRLGNIDKHDDLVPFVNQGGLSGSRIDIHARGGSGLTLTGPGRLDDGVVLMNLGKTGTVTFGMVDLRVAANLVFGPSVPVFAGEPALSVLHELTKLVEGIVQTFEAHCFGG